MPYYYFHSHLLLRISTMLKNLDTTPRYYTPHYYQEETKEQNAVPEYLKTLLSDIGLNIHFKSTADSGEKKDESSVNDKTRSEVIQETIDEGGSFEEVLGMMFGKSSESDDSNDKDEKDQKSDNKGNEIVIGRNLETNNTLKLSFNTDEDADLSYGDHLIMLDQLKDGLKYLFSNVRNTRIALTFPNVKRNERMVKRGIYAAISFEIEYFSYDDVLDTTIVAFGKRDVIRMIDTVDSVIRATPDRIEFIHKHGKTL